MCLICIEFQANKLTIQEASSNLDEMYEQIGEEHSEAVSQMIIEAEIKQFEDEQMKNMPTFTMEDTDFEFGFNVNDWFI